MIEKTANGYIIKKRGYYYGGQRQGRAVWYNDYIYARHYKQEKTAKEKEKII